MNFPIKFFKATDNYNTYERHVNAPYIRKAFTAPAFEKAYITVSGLGFYRLFVGEKEITKGLLAPYISNPDDIIYYDRYDVTDLICAESKNAVGLILGNGMQNCHGGRVWDFDIARFRNSPCFAMSITYVDADGNETTAEADEAFKCHPSPIIFDDLRSGCFYDASLEIPGWNSADFDDSAWGNVKPADNPRGEYRLCDTDPIAVTREIKPVKVFKAELDDQLSNRSNMRLDTQYKFFFGGKTGVVFDFGVNTTGVFRLKLNGKKGQKIYIQCCEYITSEGKPSYSNTGSFYPDGYGQTAYYVCKGEEGEGYTPSFCYYGGRYYVVFGLEEDQISPDTLTLLEAHSALSERASFDCSDRIMNKLGSMCRVSDLSNFWYFPTDCPHREKNGWTGDAAVSAEHVLLTLTPERSYREWLHNVCKAQDDRGALPGIVPTGGWGFAWGNGPAWDNVLTELCWQVWRMRGDLTPAKECKENILRYLSYISQSRRHDGLIAIGLGDWLQPLKGAGEPICPLYITDSVISMYIAKKSSDLFGALGLSAHKAFADSLYDSLRQAIRKNCINFSTMQVLSRSQTAQAICIYYGVFDDSEKAEACRVLVDIIREKDNHFDCGMIGIRTVFHVLSDCGMGELAYKMITRTDFPSYGILAESDMTSMPEDFIPPENWDRPNSLNHHFMGDICSWFIQKVCGIRVNPRLTSPDSIDLAPDFISSLDYARAHYDAPCGTIETEWRREGEHIILTVRAPEEMNGFIILPKGCRFVDEKNPGSRLSFSAVTELASGEYKISHGAYYQCKSF